MKICNHCAEEIKDEAIKCRYCHEFIHRKKSIVTTGNWFFTILIMAIPIVNFIMLCVWAFGDNTNPSKATWARANLLWIPVSILLVLLFFLIRSILVTIRG